MTKKSQTIWILLLEEAVSWPENVPSLYLLRLVYKTGNARFCPGATAMHYVCALFIQLLITLFSLVIIIPPLIIAVLNVLALKTLLLVSGYLKSAPSSG